MKFVRIVKNCFKDKKMITKYFLRSVLSRNISDEKFLRIAYRNVFGKNLNLDNPQTYNEKLQWLKLNDRKDIYTKMVDKYEAKKYVANIIGDEYIIPIYGVYDKFSDIDFNKLPDSFVIKCTHDCGGMVICKDKSALDVAKAEKKINKSLSRNYYYNHREWPYKNVVPRIIVEKYLVDESGYELKDYKFFCFDGKVRLLFVAKDRTSENEETKFDFFDADFNHISVCNGHPNSEPPYFKPENFDKMKELAEKLSAGIPHVRVDFYNVNGKVYFGELTFYHYSGLTPFDPPEWDKKIGDMLELPKNK